MTKCRHTRCPSDYVDWYRWAEKKSRTHAQQQCPVCGLWAVWVKKPRAAVAKAKGE